MSITGASFAVCRHQIPFGAVNLIRTGERYAYSHYLLTERLLATYQPAFIHQDIACSTSRGGCGWRKPSSARHHA
ncbi:g5331 [Coccomyxa elongata]